jgi:hypothetical protein
VPTRPSGKVRITVVEIFGGGKSQMKNGARREVQPGRTAVLRNFDVDMGGGAILGRNFDVKTGRAAREAFSATWNLGTLHRMPVMQTSQY